MKHRRLLISSDEISTHGVLFSREHSHYLRNVLRLKSGAEIQVICGNTAYLVRVGEVDQGRVRGEIGNARALCDPGGEEVVMAFAGVRPGPMEEILRHGTELGVHRFIPLVTRRTTRRPAASKDRWRTIVESACAQCGRSRVPQVEDPASLTQWLARDHGNACKIILSLGASSTPLLTVLQDRPPGPVVLMVGPEGGFDASEEEMSVREGFIPVSLTESVLRTETACIIAAGVVACRGHQCRCRQIPAVAD